MECLFISCLKTNVYAVLSSAIIIVLKEWKIPSISESLGSRRAISSPLHIS